MLFKRSAIGGVWEIQIERRVDERGYFARTWCRNEFAARGIEGDIVQASVSFNQRAGTLRGMHFAWPPAREGKLVRCTAGRAHDVVLDLRPDSSTFRRHAALVLDADTGNALYVPPGVAHGFQTLVDACEVTYMMTEAYRPELAAGVRFDDPAFRIDWPLPVTCIASRDRTYADFDPIAHRLRFTGSPELPAAGAARIDNS
jgi:dTDP-4-dehydrorhamnose 3,5-epimerase